MEATSLHLILLLCWLMCSGRVHASLRIRPNKSQFHEYKEGFSVSCEVQGSSAGWRLKRNTTTRDTSECGGAIWGRLTGSNCTIVTPFSSDSGVYWCESGSGERSSTVNITVHAGPVILESPVLPVNQGEAVTLRCRYQTTPSDLTADFYKDGWVVRTEAAGEMTIPAVSTSDEGLYKCSNSELGESPESWLAVEAPPSSLLVSLVVAGLSVSLVALLVMLLLWKRRKERPGAQPVYSAVRTDRDTERPGAQPVYSAVRTDRDTGEVLPEPVYSAVRTDKPTGGAEARPVDVTYGQLVFRPKEKERETSSLSHSSSSLAPNLCSLTSASREPVLTDGAHCHSTESRTY